MKSTDFAPRYAAMDFYIKPGWVGVEVGVDVGSHAEALLAIGVEKIYLIDIWDNKWIEGYCKGRLSRWFNRVEMIRSSSKLAAKSFPEVDFVYIDVEHDYESVKGSLNDWLPKVKHILGYRNYTLPGVKKALDEFLIGKNFKLDQYNNEIIVFK
jgi:hypothetical protein